MSLLLKKQMLFPDAVDSKAVPKISEKYTFEKNIKHWEGYFQYHHEDTFILSSIEGQGIADRLLYHRQEKYIKFHFRLTSSKQQTTTDFNGFGQYQIDRPQLFNKE